MRKESKYSMSRVTSEFHTVVRHENGDISVCDIIH